MLKNILTTKQEEILKKERQWLAELQVILASLGVPEEDQTTLKESIQQLEELFLLVVVGEFNAGKSSFINALLGHSLLKEGVTPTTAQVNILKYDEVSRHKVLESHLHVIMEPYEMLRQINIVDTPGTNAIIQKHQEITEDFVPRSDLVLFITSSDRPFTESERQFLSQIKDWGKKVVIVINKIDILEDEQDLSKVVDFVLENARILLNTDVEIFPVSARKALKSKLGDPSQWVGSRFDVLEQFIHDTLDESSRVRLKFLNPLGVGNRLLTKYLDITNNRLELLSGDVEVLENLDRQLTLYQEDMKRDFRFRLSDIEKVLFEMENRGNVFFDEVMRLGRVIDLMNKGRIQSQFEAEVVADTPQLVEQKVSELIDWLVTADFNQWQSVTKYLEDRKQEHKERIIGNVGTGFQYDRERLIESVGKKAQRVVSTYDKAREAQLIADAAQRAVTQSAMVEVGAIGLGAVITALATTVAFDVTGIIAATVFAVMGLFISPARRRVAKQEMTDKVANLRRQLMDSLSGQFDKELNRSMQRINDAIAPYSRFVRGERGKLDDVKTKLLAVQQTQEQLRAEIEGL